MSSHLPLVGYRQGHRVHETHKIHQFVFAGSNVARREGKGRRKRDRERERERERASVCVCVRERERERGMWERGESEGVRV